MAFDLKNYQLSIGEHENKKVIFNRFDYNQLWHKELKEKVPNSAMESIGEVLVSAGY